jgi:hypothetical protein
MAYVYKHSTLDTDKIFYIGIGSDLYYKRSKSKRNRSKFWQNIVLKHNYKIDIIYDNLTRDEACKFEIELIKKYGRIDLNTGILCNMTSGGDGMAELSPKAMLNLKNRMIGNSYSKGNCMSIEHRNKISQINKGRKFTNEHKEKISLGNLNKVLTQETKDKISFANKGRKMPERSIEYKEKLRIKSTGRKHTEKTKLKMSLAKKGIAPIIPKECRPSGSNHGMAKMVIDKSNGLIYGCAKDAAMALSINYSTLKNMLNGNKLNKTSLFYVCKIL